MQARITPLACDAADVGDVGDVLGADQVAEGQLRQVNVVLLHRGVDAGCIGGVGDDAVVLPGKAADEVGAVDAAGGGAALDHAGGKVIAGDAAHAGGNALKPAVVQCTGIAAGKAAHGGAAAGRHGAAAHDKVADIGPLLDIAEEADDRAVIHKAQAGDYMALPLKNATEGRDAGKAAAGQLKVGVQHNGAVLAPAVQTAVVGQLQKLVHRADVVGLLGFRLGIALPLRKDGQGKAQRQAEGEQRSPKAARQIRSAVHSASPPFAVSSAVSGSSAVSRTFSSDRYMSGFSTVSSVPVAMLALNWPCSTPLISASTTPLM